jgi:hypothetical protein
VGQEPLENISINNAGEKKICYNKAGRMRFLSGGTIVNITEEKTEKQSAASKTNVILFILLLIAVLGVAFLVYLKSTDVDISKISIKELLNGRLPVDSGEKEMQQAVEFVYDAKEQPAFCTYRDYLIKCTADRIRWIDKNGKDIKSLPISMNKPVAKVAGSLLLVYDMGGRDISVFIDRDVSWSRRLENNIVNADINDEGYVAVVHQTKGYKAGITVFNPQGMERLERMVAENFVLSAKVLPSSRQFIINRVDTSEVNANSDLEWNDFHSNKPYGDVPLKNAIFPGVWCLKDGTVAAVNNTTIVCFGKDLKEKWRQEYTAIYSSCVVMGKYLAVAAATGDGLLGSSKTEVMLFNTKGKKISGYTLEGAVEGLDIAGDLLAVNAGREIHFINTKGKLQGKYQSKAVAERIFLYNKNEAAVVTKGKVIIIRFRV